jgi:putative component of toxin-antitoxin plasmid stabilization module
MPGALFKTFAALSSFTRDLKGLDAQQRAAVQRCIEELQSDNVGQARRVHRLNPKRLGIISVDIDGGTAYKMTLTIEGDHATLRRVGQHKDIDRRP